MNEIDFSLLRDVSDFDGDSSISPEEAAAGAEKLSVKSPYLKRNSRIRRMGLSSTYAAYLASDTWKEQRARIMQRDRGKCQCCGGPATQVHHIKYTKATLRGDATFWLIAICRPCHQFIEFDDQGNKLSLSKAKSRIFLLRRRNGLTTSTSRFISGFGKPKEKHQRRVPRRR